MTELSTVSTMTYFREAFAASARRNSLDLRPESRAYVVLMLDSFVQSGAERARLIHRPLASLYAHALRREPGDLTKLSLCRAVGDVSLFLSGFFPEFAERHGHVAYYHELGSRAYGEMAHPVFDELAGKFPRIAAALLELGIRSRLASTRAIVELYTEWRRRHQAPYARFLADCGIDEPLRASNRGN